MCVGECVRQITVASETGPKIDEILQKVKKVSLKEFSSVTNFNRSCGII